MDTPDRPAPPGYRWVFPRYFVHRRTRRRVYPRNGKKCFAFLVKEDGR